MELDMEKLHWAIGMVSGQGILVLFALFVWLPGRCKEVLAVETEYWVSKHICTDAPYDEKYTDVTIHIKNYTR
ncbi:hypothetical protein pVco7_gp110 [Vibrio phage pVco-7]|uniref:Uncharacterized protein n=1 Tax=Vibrio phage pVco-5 TaxID=1965485 RepID=A0A1W6JV02_9CAUD|nr:hypothetical protein KNT61_gp111 [Vibrio phage pVco-5]ARM71099.1 hypothetical protein pVco5_110 [Vibrio phage pVco-5]